MKIQEREKETGCDDLALMKCAKIQEGFWAPTWAEDNVASLRHCLFPLLILALLVQLGSQGSVPRAGLGFRCLERPEDIESGGDELQPCLGLGQVAYFLPASHSLSTNKQDKSILPNED